MTNQLPVVRDLRLPSRDLYLLLAAAKPRPFFLWFVFISTLVFVMDSVLDFRQRTAVFSLSRGPQVSPLDFVPFLDCVKDRMVGFGTVGVGHV